MGNVKKYNKFEIIEDGKTTKIEINSPKYGTMYGYCDVEDWDNNKSSYHISKKKNLFYIKKNVVKNGKRICIGLHQLIMNPPKGMMINHKDHNGLNNRRSNLEICTQQENTRYQRLAKNNTSGYKGVNLKKNGKFEGSIRVNNKPIYLGLFDNIIECAKAYNEAAIKYFGKFAVLNEIPTV